MDKKRELVARIVELFEQLLGEKDIVVPCADCEEERERCKDGNSAKLYGMEFWILVSAVEALLNQPK